MSTLTENDVQKIAELSKLALSPEKLSAATNRLENILSLVKKMDGIDTDAVLPLAHPLNVTQPLREDTVIEQNQRDAFQRNAPYVEAGLYIVPKFVESE